CLNTVASQLSWQAVAIGESYRAMADDLRANPRVTGISSSPLFFSLAFLAIWPLRHLWGYAVHRIKRGSSSFNTARVDELYVAPPEPDTRFFMHHGDLRDATNLIRLRRDPQSRRLEPCCRELQDPRVHRQRRRARPAPAARGHPHSRHKDRVRF